jgi:hypothetical protein
VEKSSDLRIHVLYRLLFALVRLEDFQKLFIDLGFVLEAVLEKLDTHYGKGAAAGREKMDNRHQHINNK